MSRFRCYDIRLIGSFAKKTLKLYFHYKWIYENLKKKFKNIIKIANKYLNLL